MPHGDRTPLSESSPITIGLMIALVTIAFALGIGYNRLGHVETGQESLEVIVEQQYILMQSNTNRLNILEDRQRRERAQTPSSP